LPSSTVWPIPTVQTRSAKGTDWQTGQQKKWLSQKKYRRKMLLQPKYVSPSLSSWTDWSTAHRREQAHETGSKENSEGRFITPEGRILIPGKTAPCLVRLVHNITHLGKTSLQRLLHKYLVIPIGNFNSVSQQGLPVLYPT
jgi:hypothetical protein